MTNALKMLETVNQESVAYSRNDLGMEPKTFEAIAKRCGFEPILIGERDRTQIRLKKRGIPIVMLYDKDTSREFSYLDIADLHVGHPEFSPELLDSTLAKYYKNGRPMVDYVFIAGDLFEGFTEEAYTYELVEANPGIREKLVKKRNEHVKILFDILSKYDFDYRAINGNHEYTYEQVGIESPIALLERWMYQKNRHFMFYDTYIVDFIIAGVVKRMMHLEQFNMKPHSINAYERVHRFKSHGGLSPYYGDKKYPVRMFQCGHIHEKMELYDSTNKVYISQSGCFIETKTDSTPAILMQGRVTDENLVLRT